VLLSGNPRKDTPKTVPRLSPVGNMLPPVELWKRDHE